MHSEQQVLIKSALSNINERREVLAELYEQNTVFDFTFIDGSHHFDSVLVDFFFVDKMLSVDGLVVFDDLWMVNIRKAVSYVPHNRAYKLARPCSNRAIP